MSEIAITTIPISQAVKDNCFVLLVKHQFSCRFPNYLSIHRLRQCLDFCIKQFPVWFDSRKDDDFITNFLWFDSYTLCNAFPCQKVTRKFHGTPKMSVYKAVALIKLSPMTVGLPFG